MIKTISPCLWFDSNAEEAAKFYVEVFGGKIVEVQHYGKAGFEVHQRPEGSVSTVVFELNGQEFMALNGGPVFQFSEAVSLMVQCETQEEIDRYWERLSEGGDAAAQQCGWLKDKFGLSWQIVPTEMQAMFKDGDPERLDRMMTAMLQMKKLDIVELKRAYEGKEEPSKRLSA